MLVPVCLPSGRAVSCAVLGAALLAAASVSNMALAAGCPSVADPQGIKTTVPQQLDLPDFEKQIGHQVALKENPLFADQVKAGKLPPLSSRSTSAKNRADRASPSLSPSSTYKTARRTRATDAGR